MLADTVVYSNMFDIVMRCQKQVEEIAILLNRLIKKNNRKITKLLAKLESIVT
jgi:hypothetical protein